MAEDDLVIKSDVPALPQVKTVMLVNNFVANTTCFLNGFAATCEEKLSTVGRRLSDLELTLTLLEAKLNSVPGVADVTDSADVTDAADVTDSAVEAAPVEEEDPPEEEEDTTVAVKDHPTYASYFRLQKIGVPEPQIKAKMGTDGLDPSFLDDPDRRIPF